MNTNNSARHWAVVPAAGIGRRMASEKPKQYLSLNGLSVLSHSLLRLQQAIQPMAIVVAIRADDSDWPLIEKPACKLLTANGGQDRCDSVLNALQVLQGMAADDDWVWVHDAARPCVRIEDIKQLYQTVIQHNVGGLLAIPLSDTIKQVDSDQQYLATVDRNTLWRALTPQVFRYRLLFDALTLAVQSGNRVTDEAQAIELQGYKPCLVEGHEDNIKITKQGDLEQASLHLKQQETETG